MNEGNATLFQQALRSVIADISVAHVVRITEKQKDMLWGWLRGKIPRFSSVRYLLCLEGYFRLERNVLVNLSGMRPYSFKPSIIGGPTPVAYNQEIVELTKRQLCIQPGERSPLRQQWVEFARDKTTPVPGYKRSRLAKRRFSP